MDISEERRPEYEEAMAEAGAALARASALLNATTPQEAAEAAWHPGGPSLDELERMARERRASET